MQFLSERNYNIVAQVSESGQFFKADKDNFAPQSVLPGRHSLRTICSARFRRRQNDDSAVPDELYHDEYILSSYNALTVIRLNVTSMRRIRWRRNDNRESHRRA